MERFAILLIALACAASSQTQPLDQGTTAYIDSTMTAHFKPNEPGAVILVSKAGKPVFRKAYGLASVELGIPNQPEYLYCIGSMSKQFTAVCILLLAQQGKLSLQDDIRKYLTDYDTHGRQITIENLLTHTSGIPSYTEKSDYLKRLAVDYSKQEIQQYIMKDSLLFEPGTNWSYSNTGYFLAGLIVEKASGLPLEKYLQQNVFAPAGMIHTFLGTHERVIPGFVTGYEQAPDNTFKDASYFSWTWPFGAGSIISSVDDMLKWDNALSSGIIVKPQWLNKAWTSYTLKDGRRTNYGYGWTTGEYQKTKVIRHAGGINGFVCEGVRLPDQQVYMIILTNLMAQQDPSEISYRIAFRVAGVPLTPPLHLPLNSRQLQEYTGVYEIQRIGSRVTANMTREKVYRYLTVRNDTLFAQRSGAEKTPVFNISKDQFVFQDPQLHLGFRRGPRGKIVSLEITRDPVNNGPNAVEPKTDLPLPKEKTALALGLEKLATFQGKYDLGGGYKVTISVSGAHIYVQSGGDKPEEIYPESETRFFFKSVDSTIDFVKDAEGKVTGLIFHQAGDYPAKKIE